MNIHFFQEEVSYALEASTIVMLSDWLSVVAQEEKASIEALNYIFCSDPYLHKMNKKYLAHDYFTDVITFDFGDSLQKIIGDVYISIDRVKDNAQRLAIPFEEELLRVIVHGLLHLLGYQDKKTADKKEMTRKEDFALALLKKKFPLKDLKIVAYT